MKFTLKRIFLGLLVIVSTCLLTILLLDATKVILPANELTHECKSEGVELYDYPQARATGSEPGFCPAGEHAEFKDSWDRAINNAVIPIGLFAILAAVPVGAVLLYRRIPRKKK